MKHVNSAWLAAFSMFLAGSAFAASPVTVTGPNGVQAAVGTNGLKTDGSAVTQPVSAVNLPLPAGAAQDATVAVTNTNLGAPGATACATDTASCSLNQYSQRLAQRLTTINTTLGTPMQATGGTVGLVAGSAVIGHVITDTGSTTAVASLPANASVNLTQIGGATPSLTNPIWFANAEAADTTGTFTNGTQATSITATNADGYATALISIHGTYGTATGVFEASDDGGTTFYSVLCVRSDGSASETGYTSLSNVSRQWQCPVAGNDSFRIRSTAVASGTVTAQIGVSAPATPSAAMTLNAGSNLVGTVKLVDTGGTNVAAVNANGGQAVAGDVADAATDSGNPVKVGGVFLTTKPTYTNGLRTTAQTDARGNMLVGIANGANQLSVTTAQNDGQGSSNNALFVLAFGYLWDPLSSTENKVRSNFDTAALLTYAAASAGTNSADQTNWNGRGVQILVNVTAITAATLTCSVQGKDNASGVYYNILTSAALATTAATNMTVYPGAGVTANLSASMPLPKIWRVSCAITGTSVTATIGASVIN